MVHLLSSQQARVDIVFGVGDKCVIGTSGERKSSKKLLMFGKKGAEKECDENLKVLIIVRTVTVQNNSNLGMMTFTSGHATHEFFILYFATWHNY